MQAFRLHHLEKNGDVERHDRNRGARLRHDRFVHGDERASALDFQKGVDFLGLRVEILFRLPDGAVFVDRPRHRRSDVGIRDGLAAFREQSRGVERFDPELPVLAAHHLDGRLDFVFRRRFEGDFVHDFLVRVQILGRIGRADGLQHGFVDFARRGIGAARSRERIDDEVDLRHFLFQAFDDQLLHFRGKRVAVCRSRVESRFLRFRFKRRRVVPTGGRGLAVRARAFEIHAERVGAGAERRGNARREPVTRRGADDEDVLGSVLHRRTAFDVSDLLADMRGAAFRMSRDADESADAGRNDLFCHSGGNSAPVAFPPQCENLFCGKRERSSARSRRSVTPPPLKRRQCASSTMRSSRMTTTRIFPGYMSSSSIAMRIFCASSRVSRSSTSSLETMTRTSCPA